MRHWTQKQIKQHEVAGEKLGIIKNEFRDFILEKIKSKKDVYEKDCVEFIKKSYRKHGLTNDDKNEFTIVAFGINTKEVHHFGNNQYSKLNNQTLILLDIWGRLNSKNAPYADTTFMFYFGKKIPKNIRETWEVLRQSRDNAINYIQKEVKIGCMPRGLDIDRIAHDHIGNNKLGHTIKHTIGHSLGFNSPHGKLPGINWREYAPIMKNVGYTIEPGIYLENFGMRTEIDFYVNDKNEMLVTTEVQKEIQII